MSISTQALSTQGSAQVISDLFVSLREESSRREETIRREESHRYSTATDLPNFSGYHASGASVSRKRNPIAEFLPDALYDLLRNYDLINEKALRDFLIRRDYRKVRKELHLCRADAIDYVQQLYPYLQGDTIRKIIYRVQSNGAKKSKL